MFGQAAAQLLRAYRRHQTLECVRGRGRVVVGQEVEVPGTHMGELAHVDVVLTAAELLTVTASAAFSVRSSAAF